MFKRLRRILFGWSNREQQYIVYLLKRGLGIDYSDELRVYPAGEDGYVLDYINAEWMPCYEVYTTAESAANRFLEVYDSVYGV
jgi:hypothetical protein